jgi:HlyD family secretion protein
LEKAKVRRCKKLVKKIFIAIIILVVIGGFITLNVVNNKEKGTKVSVENITKGDIDSTIETSGVAQSSEEKEVYFIYDVPIKVEKVNYEKYDEVKKGDKILELEMPSGITSSMKEELQELEKSPIDGVLTELNVSKNRYTNSTEAAYTVVNTEKIYVNASVKDKYIKDIEKGQKVLITGDVLEEDEEFNGEVVKIAPIASEDVTTQGENTYVEVEISVKKPSDNLKPGLKVNCEITVESKKDVVMGNYEMLQEDAEGDNYIFIVDEKTNTVKKQKVELGLLSDMDFEITKGVEVGDKVVLDPLPTLENGDLIIISD